MAVHEEILDEGDMLQSHGLSPPRFSMVANMTSAKNSGPTFGNTIFSKKRLSEAPFTRNTMGSKVNSNFVVSPRGTESVSRREGEF